MIEIFKAENPKIIPFIVDKFSEFDNLDQHAATEHLLLKLATDPDTTGIFVLFQDEELKAFIFGWLNTIDKIAWIQQAWADPDIPNLYKNELFERFGEWGLSLGATHIQAQTERTNVKAWTRLYGLTEQAVILQKEL